MQDSPTIVKYAMVYFGPNELEEQRKFLLVMNNIRVIKISRDDIEENYQELLREPSGVENRIVLCGQEQIDKFEYALKYFFNNKQYTLMEKPDTETFSHFVKRSEVETGTP